ncbi:MAG: response regulator transcription factor [Pseudohongiellaceae bacterium]|nr:response regulator transcription factor [Pseudohongiellaceae bacterium]
MVSLEDGQALIVEDNLDTLEWLVSCVNSAFPKLGVHTASSLAEARTAMSNTEFSLALLDLGLPDGSGIDLIKELGRGTQSCYVVVATIYDDDKNLFTALKSGAKGYILKDQDRERIVSYLQGIRKNKPALSAASSQRLIDHFNNQGEALNAVKLTPREEDVVCLIGKGYSVEEAASMLKLAPDTVKGYVKSIYSKLSVSNRSELTLEAVRLGIIDSA